MLELREKSENGRLWGQIERWATVGEQYLIVWLRLPNNPAEAQVNIDDLRKRLHEGEPRIYHVGHGEGSMEIEGFLVDVSLVGGNLKADVKLGMRVKDRIDLTQRQQVIAFAMADNTQPTMPARIVPLDIRCNIEAVIWNCIRSIEQEYAIWGFRIADVTVERSKEQPRIITDVHVSFDRCEDAIDK